MPKSEIKADPTQPMPGLIRQSVEGIRAFHERLVEEASEALVDILTDAQHKHKLVFKGDSVNNLAQLVEAAKQLGKAEAALAVDKQLRAWHKAESGGVV